ncbi:MAG: hypothetical protein K6E85_04520 [Lachnospiraceae bacterium]|nr:hypothetical protein [Lachnospiraceae bacterium]
MNILNPKQQIELNSPVILPCNIEDVALFLDLTRDEVDDVVHQRRWLVVDNGEFTDNASEIYDVGDVITEEEYRSEKENLLDQDDGFMAETGTDAIVQVIDNMMNPDILIGKDGVLKDEYRTTVSKMNFCEQIEDYANLPFGYSFHNRPVLSNLVSAIYSADDIDKIKREFREWRIHLRNRINLLQAMLDSDKDPVDMLITNRIYITHDNVSYESDYIDEIYTPPRLNDIYRLIENRNERLKLLINGTYPDSIIRQEKKLLQEAVDSLSAYIRRHD